MQNFNMEKRDLPFTAPAGGVVSGSGYLIGSIFVVAKVTAAAGATFAAVVIGVVTLPKAAVAITEGATVYWDNTAFNVTTTAGANTKIGCAAQGGALSSATAISVILNGTV